MAGILDLMGHIQQQGDLGRQRGEQSRLGQLYSQALTGPRDQRQSVLGQMAQISPDAATGAHGVLSKMDADSWGEMAREAGYLVALAESGDEATLQAAYPQFAQAARQRLGFPVPETWDPKFLPGLQKLAGAAGGDDLKSLRVGANGNFWAIRGGQLVDTGTPAMPQTYVRDQPGVPFDILNKGTGQSIYDRQPPQGQPPQQWAQNGATYQTPSGIVRINDVAPEDMAAVQADIESGGAQDQYRLPSRDVAPPQARPPARPLTTTPQDSYVPLNSDEVARLGLPPGTVAQRNARTGKVEVLPAGVQPKAPASQKPLPVAAVREDLAIEDAIGANQKLANMLVKHTQRLQNGELQVSPVNVYGGKVRTALGMATANDVNLNELKADMTSVVNEWLRLNKGVQTEGDAQRAFNELMAANDAATANRALKRLADIVRQTSELQARKRELLYSNYGRTRPQSQQAPQSSGGNVIRYDAQGNRIQ